MVRRLGVKLAALFMLMLVARQGVAQPEIFSDDIVITLLAEIPSNVIQLAYREANGTLYMVRRNGDIAKVDRTTGEQEVLAGSDDHGVSEVRGFTIADDGRFFLVGTESEGGFATGFVVRGEIAEGEIPTVWNTVAVTDPYPRGTNFNHWLNAIVVDHTGKFVYVNSGSRTDHGEIEDNRGQHPGVREVPLTSKILRIPADTTDLLLVNDEAFLDANGFIYARGVRNTFDLEFDADRQLFGPDNSGRRDDNDELNWIRPGDHLGFPWRIGTTDTPQQFPEYDPETDLRIQADLNTDLPDLFKNDPDYPPRPDDIVFRDPVLNRGPDADFYRDELSGMLFEGHLQGIKTGTFSPHVSPLGLTFDTDAILAEPYNRDGFVLGFSSESQPAFVRIGDLGGSLLHLEFDYLPAENRFEVDVTRLAANFNQPIDAVLIDTVLIVAELTFGGSANLWAVSFPRQTFPDPTVSDPKVLVEGVTIRRVGPVQSNVIRLVYAEGEQSLYYLTRSGDIYRLDLATETPVLVATTQAHDVQDPRGMELGPNGYLYLLGNEPDGTSNVATLKRAQLGDGLADGWTTVATTEPYPLSGTPFDHLMNGLAVSADGRYVYVSSGSRTDHGEIQDLNGVFPDLRETPITAKVLRIPADTTDLLLLNDDIFLESNGFVFARGFRNTFDLAWGPGGRLFGVENSGDRDDSEELNWIRQGRHYGFPWRIGTNDTPQQNPDYDPDQDFLIGPGAQPVFSQDLTYPEPDENTLFVDPIPNDGPDADAFRDPGTGILLDGSDEGLSVGSFTAHRSPLGLLFDTAAVLGEPYTADAFVFSWNSAESTLLGPLRDRGQDLLHLNLNWSPEDSMYRFNATQLVTGFRHPIDAVLVGSSIFVAEMNFVRDESIWEVKLPERTSRTGTETETLPGRLDFTAYPNPFSDRVTIEFSASLAAAHSVDMFDVLGRVVWHRDLGPLTAGSHSIAVDVQGLPAGIYFMRLSDGNQVAQRRLIQVR